jgi:hypothetical protein
MRKLSLHTSKDRRHTPCSSENFVNTCGPFARRNVAHPSQPLTLLTQRQARRLHVVSKPLQQLLLQFYVCGSSYRVWSAARSVSVYVNDELARANNECSIIVVPTPALPEAYGDAAHTDHQLRKLRACSSCHQQQLNTKQRMLTGELDRSIIETSAILGERCDAGSKSGLDAFVGQVGTMEFNRCRGSLSQSRGI